jgi:hypothetical protein
MIRSATGAAALAAALQITLGTIAFAQPAVTPQPEGTLSLSPPNGDIDRPGMNTASRFQFDAASTSNQATVTLGDQGPAGTGSSWMWSLTLSNPITMGSDSSGGPSATNTKIATLDGLANGFQAKFKLGGFYSIATVRDLSPADVDALEKIQQAAEAACAEVPGNTQAKCSLANNQQGPFIQQYARDLYPKYEMTQIVPHHGLLGIAYGAQAAVGYDTFTSYSAGTLAKSTQNSEPWSTGVYVGIMPASGDYVTYPSMITFAATYQSAYQAQSSKTMCDAMGAGISCATGSFGAPTHTEKYLLSLDMAQQLKIPLPGSAKRSLPAGIDPLVTYDAKAHVWGVDVPIYVIPNASGALIGGIDLGWTSCKNAFSVGVFVGVPFGIFKSVGSGS